MKIDNIKMDFIEVLENDCKMLAHGISSNAAHKFLTKWQENTNMLLISFIQNMTLNITKGIQVVV